MILKTIGYIAICIIGTVFSQKPELLPIRPMVFAMEPNMTTYNNFFRDLNTSISYVFKNYNMELEILQV
jgi:hypothetical protein